MREIRKLSIPFPPKGINVTGPRFIIDPEHCINAQNVRVYDSLEGRSRGGIREGLSKYCSATFAGSGRIQDINYATAVRNTAPNTGALYVRDVIPAAVSNGTIQMFNTTTITNATAGGAATLSNTAPFIFSAELFGRLYYTDGINYKIWVASNNTTSDWTVSAGTIPGTAGTRIPRLIERWRGRIVLSGLASDPNNWFMSALGDPLDFDYAPDTITETQAVTGSVGVVGKLGEPITSLVPYSDDVLLFGADASIWQMSGDPQAGGRFDLITDKVGMAFGRPWCRDVEGNVYFFSSRGEVYILPPGGVKPQSLTKDNINPLIITTNLNTHLVRMEWNQEAYGIHVFITPFSAGSATHWFFDMQTGGWFKDVFANTNYNPISVKLFDGDSPSDRVMLIGSEDGRIRFFDPTVARDDSNVFKATATLGPVTDPATFQQMILSDIQTVTDVNGAQVKVEILSGDTPEQAVQSEDGTFVGDLTMEVGLSQTYNPRQRGYAHYVKVGTNAATSSWGLEEVRITTEQIVSDKSRIKAS